MSATLDDLFAQMADLQARIEEELGRKPFLQENGEPNPNFDVIAAPIGTRVPTLRLPSRNTTPLEPCTWRLPDGSECGAPGVQWIGVQCACVDCASALLVPLYERFIVDDGQGDGQGVGRQIGVLQPWYGVGVAELMCDRCFATWSDRIGSVCPVCADAAERIVVEHRSRLLAGPVYGETGESWARRLAHATDAGVITDDEAETAISRQSASSREQDRDAA